MTLFQSILLGIIQGLTEFLPISSSAHLVLVPTLLHWNIPQEASFLFDVLIQIGTLAAVLVYFRKDLNDILAAVIRGLITRKPFETTPARLGWLVVIATIPAGLFGVLVKPLVEKAFANPTATALMLIVTALILFLAERFGRQSRAVESIRWTDALWIGLAQAFAIFPGISRSGATISAGMGCQLKRESAARFSFVMSIPIILASILFEIKDLLQLGGLTDYLPMLIVGILAAGITGFLCIHWLLRFLGKHPLYGFSVYCLAVAVMMLFTIHVL